MGRAIIKNNIPKIIKVSFITLKQKSPTLGIQAETIPMIPNIIIIEIKINLVFIILNFCHKFTFHRGVLPSDFRE